MSKKERTKTKDIHSFFMKKEKSSLCRCYVCLYPCEKRQRRKIRFQLSTHLSYECEKKRIEKETIIINQ